jgi:hypothetical protein
MPLPTFTGQCANLMAVVPLNTNTTLLQSFSLPRDIHIISPLYTGTSLWGLRGIVEALDLERSQDESGGAKHAVGSEGLVDVVLRIRKTES